MKTPQVNPPWNTGIYIGNGTVAEPDEDQILKRMNDARPVTYTCDCPEWDKNGKPMPPCNH